MSRRAQCGFTIVELLVVVSIIALLIGILLPAVGRARDNARRMLSQSNLRQLAIANATYESEWNGAQLSLTDYNLGRYGQTAGDALEGMEAAEGRSHPGILLGWGHGQPAGWGVWGFYFWGGANAELVQAIDFNSGFGWFRMPNVQAFNQYLSGRFLDPVFYAPKDTVVLAEVEPWLSNPDEYVPSQVAGGFFWSSYCFSPAALVSPAVYSNPVTGKGFQDPFSMPSGMRTPAASQARFPDLKTRMLEHHWLQSPRADCNANINNPTYGGCEPFYFCHSLDSVPVTLFYDGHVAGVGVQDAQGADQRQERQAGYGLWHRDAMGPDGYFGRDAYDFRANNASFHILTMDGILGRDVSGE